MELTLEKVMLMVVGLCFASMICIPLIQNGTRQISDQYAYSQFQDLVGLIDSEIRTAMNNTDNRVYEGDVYVPRGVTIDSSTSYHRVDYHFNSDSTRVDIHKDYPLAIVVSFNYMAGWYRIKIAPENATFMTASFTLIESD